MFERRTYIRIPAGLHGRYRTAHQTAAPRLGFTQDISMGGMQMAVVERLDPGDRVFVDLPLPREGEVGLTGVVLWSRQSNTAPGGYEVGMKWAALDLAVQARLHSYINSYTRAQSASVTTSITTAVTAPPREEPLISWPRTIAVALVLSLLLLMAAQLWLRWSQMALEYRSFRQTFLNAQHLIQSRVNPE